MDTEVKQLIWIVLIISILVYIYYINSNESFKGVIYDVKREQRESFMLFGANNKSKPNRIL